PRGRAGPEGRQGVGSEVPRQHRHRPRRRDLTRPERHLQAPHRRPAHAARLDRARLFYRPRGLTEVEGVRRPSSAALKTSYFLAPTSPFTAFTFVSLGWPTAMRI